MTSCGLCWIGQGILHGNIARGIHHGGVPPGLFSSNLSNSQKRNQCGRLLAPNVAGDFSHEAHEKICTMVGGANSEFAHVAASEGPGARPSGVEWPPWRGGQLEILDRSFLVSTCFKRLLRLARPALSSWPGPRMSSTTMPAAPWNFQNYLQQPQASAPSTQPFVPHLPRCIWRSYLPKITLALSNSCMITTNTKSVTTWCVDSYLIGAARFRLGILLLFLNFHLLQKMCQMFFLVLLKARKKISSETFRNGNFFGRFSLKLAVKS